MTDGQMTSVTRRCPAFILKLKIRLLINRVASKTEYAKIYDSDQLSIYYQLEATTILFKVSKGDNSPETTITGIYRLTIGRIPLGKMSELSVERCIEECQWQDNIDLFLPFLK